MKRMVLGLFAVVALAACTPADQIYCQDYGVKPNSAEFGKCIAYYHQQEAAFGADRGFCESQADMTYPQSLYDRGHQEEREVCEIEKIGKRKHRHCHTEYTDIGPDYQHNNEVDRLRDRIIEPCMQSRGWNSSSGWRAGRHAVVAVPAPAGQVMVPAAQGLPWAR